jgi:uncharacterized membrane protein
VTNLEDEPDHQSGDVEQREGEILPEGEPRRGDVLSPEEQAEAAYIAWSYSGPIPLPRVAEGWEDVLPGAADRILSMAEREQGHRHEMSNRALGLFGRGQLFGFVMAMTALLAGTVLIAMDKEAVGLATILSALAVLVGVFIYGRMSGNDEGNGPPGGGPRELPPGESP